MKQVGAGSSRVTALEKKLKIFYKELKHRMQDNKKILIDLWGE